MKHNHFSTAIPARLRGVLTWALVLCLLAVSFSGCQAADLSDVPETSVPSQASSMSEFIEPSAESEGTLPLTTQPSAAAVTTATESSWATETSQETELSTEAPTQPTEHVHTYTSKVTLPTCTTGGFTTYTCQCGYSYNSNSTPALGHTWGPWKTDVPATTTQTGQESRTCTVCGEVETRVLDLLPEPTEHSHVYAAEVHKPTCTEVGFTIYTCTCGDSYRADEVPATGHTWGDWSVKTPATETTAGTEVRTCTVCGEEEFRETSLTTPDHTHSYTSTVVAATCDKSGYTLHACSCGDSYKSNESGALGHSWVDDGNGTTHTCTACGKSETIPASGTADSTTTATDQ